MDKITNVFGTNQKTKRILSQLTQFLLYKPDMPHLKITKGDFELLLNTFELKQQENMRNNMMLLGVPIYPVN